MSQTREDGTKEEGQAESSEPEVTTESDESQAFYKRIFSGAGGGMLWFARRFGRNTEVQKAAGRKNPKERLVRHGRGSRNEFEGFKKFIKAIWRIIVGWLPFLAPLIAFWLFAEPDELFAPYIAGHLSLLLIPLVPLVAIITYMVRNFLRAHPIQPRRKRNGRPSKPRKYPVPKLPPTHQWIKDVNDILANLDSLFFVRLPYLIGLAAATVLAGYYYPLNWDLLVALFTWDMNQEQIQALLITIGAPLFAGILPRFRTSFVVCERHDEIKEAYTIAKSCLGYTKPPRNAQDERLREHTPHQAVDVKKWWALYEIDRAFVIAPSHQDAQLLNPWDDMAFNLNVKMYRPEEWRVQRDPKGRGATIGPANYPTQVLWDGQMDPDPLTFWIGPNLETGDQEYLTFSNVSPHMALSGGTASGKDLRLSTTVMTPSGPKRVGDLKMGDTIFEDQGRCAQVTSMSDITTPKQSYRVTFSDDTWVTVSDTHPWTTWNRAARRAASRQRRQGASRARQPWLSDHQRAILTAEIERTTEGEDISRTEVSALLGIGKDTAPLVEVASMVGACREAAITKEFVYAEQEVVQEQNCTVFDRSEVQTLVTALSNSPRAGVREAAKSVKVLERNGEGPVSVPELTKVTGIDRARMRGLVKRSGVKSLRKERVQVNLSVPGQVVSRSSPAITHFYPKRPLLEALIVRGLLDKHDQRDKMALPAVRTTQEIADTLRYRAAGADESAESWANHSIPRSGPVQFPERDLPLDPYVMGAWLGDGPSAGVGLWASEDESMIEELRSLGVTLSFAYKRGGHKVYNCSGINAPLRATGVFRDKHLPDDYLYSSIDQRLALLQGLMDTDGSVNRVSGTCEFYQSNEAIARQVRSLIASLGMIAHIRSKPGGYRDALTGEYVECKEVWTVSFTPTMQVFRLDRKAALIDPEREAARAEHRYIVSVEPVEPEPMRCIMVNSDSHQFLVTDQYVATHNTSLAEIIAAQVLIKPMPWDPNLYGRVVVVDPKGPFARRWLGRPNVVVANGQDDAAEPDDEGQPVTGPQVMAAAMQWIEEEHQRRAAVLGQYDEAATWMDLSDEVKARERFYPMIVILDEYIDHTDVEKANGDERIEKENDARNIITRLTSWHARKYRNVGMHTILIAQEVKMTGNTGIGSALLRNLPVRGVTGQMDKSQLRTMFGDNPVPSIPSSRTVIENGEQKTKTIPGRARIMNAGGQTVYKIQVPWFGGSFNADTLNKWLPRGEAAPNGEFYLSDAKPRKPEDFDEEGNLISGEVITSDEELDRKDDSLILDEHGNLERDDSPPQGQDEPSGAGSGSAPSSEPQPEFEDDDEDSVPMPPPLPEPVQEEAEDVEDWGEPVEEEQPDSQVFPAAEEKPRCVQENCVNDAAVSCPRCSSGVCRSHIGKDPEGEGPMCLSCQREHMVFQTAEFEEVYTKVSDLVASGKSLSMKLDWPSDGVLRMTVSITSGKLAAITLDRKESLVSSRSRSDSAEGMEEVLNHVYEVVDRHTQGDEQ